MGENSTHQFSASEYQDLVGAVRDLVSMTVPAGGRCLVISRGDEELVRFEHQEAWHFPRGDDGGYAGFHPESGEQAIDHLRSLHDQGARYLIIPATSLWWLDFYSNFADYLAHNATTVCRDPSAHVYALRDRHGLQPASPDGVARPLGRLLSGILPAGASVAVVSSGDSRLLALDGCSAQHFPQGVGGTYISDLEGGTAAALAQLVELRDRGVKYLMVPSIAPSWLDTHSDFLEQVERTYACVAHRRHVGTLYALDGLQDEAPQSIRAPEAGADHLAAPSTSRLRRFLKKLR